MTHSDAMYTITFTYYILCLLQFSLNNKEIVNIQEQFFSIAMWRNIQFCKLSLKLIQCGPLSDITNVHNLNKLSPPTKKSKAYHDNHDTIK